MPGLSQARRIMAKTTGVWGIDIGQCALKALRLEVIDGQPTATAFDYIEHPKILSQPDADPDALTREALETFLSRNPVGRDHVAIGVPGQAGLVRFVKLPPVEEKKVMDIVKFEAKQQIPFPLDEVVWDFQRLSDKQEVIGGFAMETEIGLFAMKRDIINRHLAHYQGVKSEVHLVQMAPLALANYATYELLKKRGGDAPAEEGGDLPPGKRKRCVVILDIGTEGSNLLITDGVKVIWQRPVPLGGNNFTRVLTKEMKLTFAKAEHLKRHAAKSPDLAQILKALRPVLTDFVGEVQRSLGYFTNTHRDAHVAYMVGLGSAFKLPGLQKYLSEKLSLEVKKPTKIDGVAGEAVLNDAVFLENALTFPVAYGLALQGLSALQEDPDQQKRFALLRTNLLPGEIHVDRMIRAKKPWAAATAACLLLGVGAVAMGFGCQYGAATDANLQKAIADAKQAAKESGDREAAYKKKDQEVSGKHAEVKALVAGNEERLNWVRLHEVIATAMPRPPLVQPNGNYIVGPDGKTPVDVGNLNLPARDAGVKDRETWKAQPEFIHQDGAYDAIARYAQRVRAGVPADRLYDNTKVELLPLVNVEAIDCRWTDNLQQFLDTANTQAKKEYGLNVVGDLLDERTIQLPTPAAAAGEAAKGPEELKLPAEREAAETPNARPSGNWHKFNPKAPAGAGWVVEVRGYTYHTDGFDFVRYTLVRNLQEAGTKFAQETNPLKVGKYIPDLKDAKKDPVLGKVSHAFLFAQKVTKANDPTRKDQPIALSLATTSFIDKLIAAQATGGTPDGGMPGGSPSAPGGTPDGGTGTPPGVVGGPGGPGGYGTGTAGGWAGLIRGGSSSSLSGSYFGGGGSEDGGGAPPPGTSGVSGPGSPGPGGPGGPGAPAAPQPNAKNTKQLTEFVVYFIWMEPSATDPAAAK
jgi:type IV pilus assembly protein PilM